MTEIHARSDQQGKQNRKSSRVNWKRIWSSKAGTVPTKEESGQGTFKAMKAFIISFKVPAIRHVSTGLSALCHCKQEEFVVSGNLSFGLDFKIRFK